LAAFFGDRPREGFVLSFLVDFVPRAAAFREALRPFGVAFRATDLFLAGLFAFSAFFTGFRAGLALRADFFAIPRTPIRASARSAPLTEGP
jgi:hypothetical protein